MRITNEFKDEIEKRILGRFPEGTVRIDIHPQRKNNGAEYEGLNIMENKPETSRKQITPVIYLDPYFAAFENGKMDLDEISETIMESYNDAKASIAMVHLDMEAYFDYTVAKQNLFISLVNKKMNLDMACVKKEYLDLYMVPRLMVGSSGGQEQIMSCSIKRELLERWNVSAEQVVEDALNNSETLMPAIIEDMQDVVESLCWEYGIAVPKGIRRMGRSLMYVISNTQNCFGAAAILYQDILKNLSEQLENDLIIIPATVDECIILKANDFTDKTDMQWITNSIQEVNASDIATVQILSDHAYYYSRENGLRCA